MSWERFPWRHQREAISESTELRGLILRIHSVEDATIVKEALRLGRNVIVLIPSAALAHPYPYGVSNEASQKLEEALLMLNISPNDWQIAQNAYWTDKSIINWNEIKTNTPGRLFVTHDAFLSDGFFLQRYGFSVEKPSED